MQHEASTACGFIFHFSLYSSAFCEVDPCPLRQGLTPPEFKPFSSLSGLQASSRGAGQCLRQGHIYVSHLDPLHPAFYASLSSLCCVFPGCWKADYTTHSYTHPNPDLFSLYFSIPLLSAHLSWENKPLLSSCCLVSLCVHIGTQRYVAA